MFCFWFRLAIFLPCIISSTVYSGLYDRSIKKSIDENNVNFLEKICLKCNKNCAAINSVKIYDFKNNKKYSPLIYAIKNKVNVRIIELLLHYKVDPNYSDSQGNTALHYAALCDNTESIPFLIKYGAQDMLCNNNQMTPLMIFADKLNDVGIQILMPYSSDIYQTNVFELTAFDYYSDAISSSSSVDHTAIFYLLKPSLLRSLSEFLKRKFIFITEGYYV